jgi:hypothetical protein
MHLRNVEPKTGWGALAALALAGFLICAPVSGVAYAQDSQAGGGAGGSADAGGGDTAGSGVGAGAGASADGDSASGSGESGAGSSQTSDGGDSSANTGSESTANAGENTANASTNVTGTGTTSDGPDQTGSVGAEASAETIGTPSAEAATTVNGTTTTEAQATYGQPAYADCSAGCKKQVEKSTARKTVAIAIAPDGSYSIAVAKKDSAWSKSGVKFRGRTLNAAVKAMVSAYAKATRSYALAYTRGGASASSRAAGGFSNATSWSNAFACVGDCPQKKLSKKQKQHLAKQFYRCTWFAKDHVLICPKPGQLARR